MGHIRDPTSGSVGMENPTKFTKNVLRGAGKAQSLPKLVSASNKERENKFNQAINRAHKAATKKNSKAMGGNGPNGLRKITNQAYGGIGAGAGGGGGAAVGKKRSIKKGLHTRR